MAGFEFNLTQENFITDVIGDDFVEGIVDDYLSSEEKGSEL